MKWKGLHVKLVTSCMAWVGAWLKGEYKAPWRKLGPVSSLPHLSSRRGPQIGLPIRHSGPVSPQTKHWCENCAFQANYFHAWPPDKHDSNLAGEAHGLSPVPVGLSPLPLCPLPSTSDRGWLSPAAPSRGSALGPPPQTPLSTVSNNHSLPTKPGG